MAVENQREQRWLEYSLGKLDEGSVSSSETVTWAAYHASTQTEEDPPTLTSLLPLFYEKAATTNVTLHDQMVRVQLIFRYVMERLLFFICM